MRVRRIGGSVVVAAALAGAAAAPAQAMIGPACSTRVVLGTPGTCSFDSPTDYATITVVPVLGTVKAELRCFTPYGYTYTSSRSFTQYGTWAAWAPGSCSLTLSGGTGSATAAPGVGPVIDPPPPTPIA